MTQTTLYKCKSTEYKKFKTILKHLEKQIVLISTNPYHIVTDSDNVKFLTKNIFSAPNLLEVWQGYWVHKDLCYSIQDRCNLLSLRIPKNMVVVLWHALWVYTGIGNNNKLALDTHYYTNSLVCSDKFSSQTCGFSFFDHVLNVADFGLPRADILMIGNLEISCIERTLIDLIRYGYELDTKTLHAIKNIKGIFAPNSEKFIQCLGRMGNFINKDKVMAFLQNNNFI